MVTRRFFLLTGVAGCVLGVSHAAPVNTLANDEAIIAAQIKRLENPSNAVRADAADVLRRVIARYPSGTSNLREADAGKARWEKVLSQIRPGMTQAALLKLVPSAKSQQSLGGSGGHTTTYRLDDHWETTISFVKASRLNDDGSTVSRVYGLKPHEKEVTVQPPKGFTGTWTCWYINGQKAFVTQYKNGVINGIHVCFHDNGRKSYEQHYTNQVASGTDTGWYPSGKRMYKGQYKNDKQVGTWTHWYENGRKRVENTYKDGKNDGPSISWYENGRKQYESHYRNGLEDGVVAAWTEQGTLEYKHEYKSGKIQDN